MSEILDRCGLGYEGVLERLNERAKAGGQIVDIDKPPINPYICDVEDYNNEIIFCDVIPNSSFNPISSAYSCYTWRSKLTEVTGHHNCFVRYEAKTFVKGALYDEPVYNYFLLSDSQGAYTYVNPTIVRYSNHLILNGSKFGGDNVFTLSAYQGGHITDSNIDNDLPVWLSASNPVEISSKYKAINNEISGLYLTTPINHLTAYRGYYSVIPTTSTNYATAWSYEKLAFPVFDINDTDAIIKFLKTGDTSGSIDPYDKTPKAVEIQDLESSFRLFVTPLEGDNTKTKFSAICYNEENIVNWGSLKYGYQSVIFESRNSGTGVKVGESKTGMKYPELTWYTTIRSSDLVVRLDMSFACPDTEEVSPIWSAVFKYNSSSAGRLQCTGGSYNNTSISRVPITDGYRFTNSDGKWLEVLFRAPQVEDLNGGYPDPDDVENDEEGTDSTFSGASGMRTFAIDDTTFDAINKKLWSTDWTQVFKSSSIDPVKCVISCKGVPFTADPVSSAEIVIANMNTGVNKNYVKTVKSYKTASILMPHFNGDYTDITLTHVRCYLPYVGWVELPASEVISRVAYSNVGIEARPKRLGFKYLVDFVDGSVRCVVSVNDTERWFFDGNCAVDVPVTSDNHTQAISNAIRSGVQTGLSIVTSIAGAVTSNAGAIAGGVIGAMQNAPNIYPTYSYTATSNGSGYINSSMNQHIMIVIERPNVIRDKDYNKRVGVPCGLSLNLGSLRGFTVCKEVDVNGIDATPDELAMIKSTLESGIYL